MITIRLHGNGKIGPAEYRAGSTAGAHADVFDETGRQLDGHRYPSWVLTRGQTLVKRHRNERCIGAGFSMFTSGDVFDTPGSYRLSVNVVTDGGAKGNSRVRGLGRGVAGVTSAAGAGCRVGCD